MTFKCLMNLNFIKEKKSNEPILRKRHYRWADIPTDRVEFIRPSVRTRDLINFQCKVEFEKTFPNYF